MSEDTIGLVSALLTVAYVQALIETKFITPRNEHEVFERYQHFVAIVGDAARKRKDDT